MSDKTEPKDTSEKPLDGNKSGDAVLADSRGRPSIDGAGKDRDQGKSGDVAQADTKGARPSIEGTRKESNQGKSGDAARADAGHRPTIDGGKKDHDHGNSDNAARASAFDQAIDKYIRTAAEVTKEAEQRNKLHGTMLEVIEERHSHNGFARIDALDQKADQAIVSAFVSVGEAAKGEASNAKSDRYELFDLGAQIYAQKYGLEKDFLVAAQRGDQDRQKHDDRTLHMWKDGTVSNRVERKEALERAAIQRALKTLANVEGGLFGAIGAGIGGDAGSDMGATVDGAVGATSSATRSRDVKP